MSASGQEQLLPAAPPKASSPRTTASLPLCYDPLRKGDRFDRSIPPAGGHEVVTNIPDYYDLLELDRSATQEEIGRAYRYFVKRCHPVTLTAKQSKKKDVDDGKRMIALYNEAYEVLGNPKSRAVYDFYGGVAARNGILHERFDYREGAYNPETSENPEGYFRNFTYSKSILPKVFRKADMLKSLLTARDRDLNFIPSAPEVSELHLSLEELYNGGVKTINRKRRLLDQFGSGFVISEEPIEITIFPGWTDGMRVLFPKMGPMDMCTEKADLIMDIVVDPHPRFRAKGYDLYTTITIPLADAMGIGPITLEHLDGRILSINLTEMANPHVAKLIPNEGLSKNTYRVERGELYVGFDIIFPDEIDPWQKLELWVALVEYPRPKVPLHYGIAPISMTSLPTAKQMSFSVPNLEDLLKMEKKFEEKELKEERRSADETLTEQLREDTDFVQYSPENLENIAVPDNPPTPPLEDSEDPVLAEGYAEVVEAEDMNLGEGGEQVEVEGET